MTGPYRKVPDHRNGPGGDVSPTPTPPWRTFPPDLRIAPLTFAGRPRSKGHAPVQGLDSFGERPMKKKLDPRRRSGSSSRRRAVLASEGKEKPRDGADSLPFRLGKVRPRTCR